MRLAPRARVGRRRRPALFYSEAEIDGFYDDAAREQEEEVGGWQ